MTKRDTELLMWTARLRYLSTSLASEFFFDGNVRIARRRLKRLCDTGFLSWFLRPAISRGSLEHVFYLNKKRQEEINFILGNSPSFYRPPRNPLLTNHDLEVGRFVLCLQRCCDSTEYSFEFFSGNEGQSKDVLPFVGKKKKSFVPDCTMKLDGSKGSSLLFLEIDTGSESIIAASRKKSDVQKKLNSYLGYLKYRGYERLSRKLGYQFKG
ncbi:MAG: replication-relaxation family protein, partial [Candidatus Heimdallarchaeota archaeon]|nr:replication-relaxation family protein [Candidatus Heimdallarchaeota archaeon]